MGWYPADVLCAECGQIHRAASEIQIVNDPTKAGTVAELYGDGPLPPALAVLLQDALWCDQARGYVQIGGWDRVILMPREQR